MISQQGHSGDALSIPLSGGCERLLPAREYPSDFEVMTDSHDHCTSVQRLYYFKSRSWLEALARSCYQPQALLLTVPILNLFLWQLSSLSYIDSRDIPLRRTDFVVLPRCRVGTPSVLNVGGTVSVQSRVGERVCSRAPDPEARRQEYQSSPRVQPARKHEAFEGKAI